MDHSDIKLAEKLRREYPEQFYTLVRMHLSFILDLNTDESDLGHEKNKFKPSKWVSVAFSKKPKCPSKGVMEGAPLTQEGICQVYQLIEFLGKEQNIIQEGIFRRSGKMTRQNELKAIMNQGVPLKLEEGNFSVHDCASVLKNFLAELPEPLLTDAHIPAYYQIADICNETTSCRGNEKRLLRALQLLLLLLPIENRVLLRDLLQLLHKTSCHEAKNKMSADNLATLFTPHLICPRKLTPEALHNNAQKMSGVVAFMIKQEKCLFNIPPKLATDVRAFWIEHKKSRRTPQMCRVSTDSLTASTVFTFVDRERSAEVQKQVGDPTEVALAQLYAHIQTLPESQHKRRLVKQFNRENGRGTPLRFKPHGRSRSLGDSIKRHIFKTGSKLEKSENSLGQQCSFIRSLSQEDASTPTTAGHHIKIFEKHGNEVFTPYCEFPTLKKSLCDSNSNVVRLRYSRKTAKPVLLRRRLICVDSENSMCEDSNVIVTRYNTIGNGVSDSLNSGEIQGSFSNKRHEPCQVVVDNSSQVNFPCDSGKDKELSVDKPFLIHATDNCNRHVISSEFPIAAKNKKVLEVAEHLQCKRSVYPKSVTFEAEGGHNNCAVSINNVQSVSMEGQRVYLPNEKNYSTWINDLASEHMCLAQDTQSPSLLPSTPIWAASTPALQVIGLNQSSSISPITRSTQRMPKAMQETMMTPRSRKPVVVLSGSNICHLSSLSGVKSPDINKKTSDVEESCLTKATVSSGCLDLHLNTPKKYGDILFAESCVASRKSPSERNALECEASGLFNIFAGDCVGDCCNGGSLTSPFKSYLSSRSVLTASPIDLSFTNHDCVINSSAEEHRILLNSGSRLNDSLLFCLNGGHPSSLNNQSVGSNNLVTDKTSTLEMAISDPEVENKSPSCSKNLLHETSL